MASCDDSARMSVENLIVPSIFIYIHILRDRIHFLHPFILDASIIEYVCVCVLSMRCRLAVTVANVPLTNSIMLRRTCALRWADWLSLAVMSQVPEVQHPITPHPCFDLIDFLSFFFSLAWLSTTKNKNNLTLFLYLAGDSLFIGRKWMLPGVPIFNKESTIPQIINSLYWIDLLLLLSMSVRGKNGWSWLGFSVIIRRSGLARWHRQQSTRKVLYIPYLLFDTESNT